LDHLRSFVSLLPQLTSCVISHDTIYSQTRLECIKIVPIFQTAFALQNMRYIEDKNLCKEITLLY